MSYSEIDKKLQAFQTYMKREIFSVPYVFLDVSKNKEELFSAIRAEIGNMDFIKKSQEKTAELYDSILDHIEDVYTQTAIPQLKGIPSAYLTTIDGIIFGNDRTCKDFKQSYPYMDSLSSKCLIQTKIDIRLEYVYQYNGKIYLDTCMDPVWQNFLERNEILTKGGCMCAFAPNYFSCTILYDENNIEELQQAKKDITNIVMKYENKLKDEATSWIKEISTFTQEDSLFSQLF